MNADGLISTGNGLLGFNMYSYCDNNPISKIDPAGHDAIIVADYDEIPVVGHMYLYVQDETGKWHRTEIRGSISETIDNFKNRDYTIVSRCDFDDEVDQDEIDSLLQHKGFWNVLGSRILGLWGVDTEYLEGDYSACVSIAKSMKADVYDYNLLNNNCGTHVRDVLRNRKNASCEFIYNCLNITPIPRFYLQGLRLARIFDENARQHHVLGPSM